MAKQRLSQKERLQKLEKKDEPEIPFVQEPGKANPNQWIYLGPIQKFKALYESAYPDHIRAAPILYICHFCLRPMTQLTQFEHHIVSFFK